MFTQFREMGELLVSWIGERLGTEPDFIHGGVSVKKRQEMVDRFQNDPEDRVMVLSLKAAGTGLNLTAASAVIHYDLWWNPAVEDQATDRAYRIGQSKNVGDRGAYRAEGREVARRPLEERAQELPLHDIGLSMKAGRMALCPAFRRKSGSKLWVRTISLIRCQCRTSAMMPAICTIS